MNSGKVPQQVVVLGAIAVALIASFLVLRAKMTPKSFGKYGHYRADAIEEIRNQPVSYAGVEVCSTCHEDVFRRKAKGFHRGVSCEVCHGPAAAHAEDNSIKPEAPRQREGCPLCHNYNAARPTGFPQIITAQHNPGKPCMSCHNPHDPVPPKTPEDCGVCHRGISAQKLVSKHVSVGCTTCHQVPKDHIVNPRVNRVGKPTDNDSCGSCHGTEVKGSPQTPKVEMAKHAGRYLCWECHYPHLPENTL